MPDLKSLRFPLQLRAISILLCFAAPAASAAVSSLPARFQAITDAHALFDISSTVPLPGGSTTMRGSADVGVTLNPGSLTINSIEASLLSATWSGSGSFVNSSFQTVNISLSIVTNPTTFSIQSTRELSLIPNSNGELAFGTPMEFAGSTSTFRFSGSYTLSGPTETVTGTFDHSVTSRGLGANGYLRVPGTPDQIELTGGLAAFLGNPSVDLPLVNATVDGVTVRTSAFGVRSNMGADFGNANRREYTTFDLVPEPSSTLLLGLAGTALILRRRRVV